MNKFGLIDIFTKLSSDKNAQDFLSTAVKSLLNGNEGKAVTPAPAPKTPSAQPTKKANNEAILSLLKRHDEISKSIDLAEKNKPLR